MKTIKIPLLVLFTVLFTNCVFAKNHTTGLYLNLQDYRDHKLSYTDSKISVSGFFGAGNVKVTRDGKTLTIAKTELFGYSRDGQDYRFFNNTEYKILKIKNMVIYSRNKLVLKNKDLTPVETYYFSAELTDPVQLLTIANLEKSYAKNPRFTYSVESMFKNDSELTEYDANNKEYKLQYLYAQSSR